LEHKLDGGKFSSFHGALVALGKTDENLPWQFGCFRFFHDYVHPRNNECNPSSCSSLAFVSPCQIRTRF